MRKSSRDELKIYALPFVVAPVVIFSILLIVAILMTILVPASRIGGIFLIAVTGLSVLYWVWYLCRPIYITKEGIRRGKSYLDWQDVRIVTYPTLFLIFGRGNPSVLVFCDKNNDIKEEVKKQRRKGCFLLIKEKSLNIVFGYYHHKIDTLDSYCDSTSPVGMSKKCKEKILEHNAKYS